MKSSTTALQYYLYYTIFIRVGYLLICIMPCKCDFNFYLENDFGLDLIKNIFQLHMAHGIAPCAYVLSKDVCMFQRRNLNL